MAEHLLDGRVTLHAGDCLDVLAELPEASVDAVVTDPPYHLASIVKRFGADGAAPAKSNGATGVYARASRGFIGMEWDGSDVAFRAKTWAAVARVMKPGAHLLAFGAPRNFGFMQVAMAEAGFECRDVLAWVFGSGFPKSHNLDGEWDGWGTALKPAYEPILLCRKPLSERTVAANVLKHGTGALNIDATRIPGSKTPAPVGKFGCSDKVYGAFDGRRDGSSDHLGRWPANLAHDGSEEACAGFPETGAASDKPRNNRADDDANVPFTSAPGGLRISQGHADNGGSAARYFYTAKADAADRIGSKHPTVKPIDLMQWLCRMVTPPGGTVLDPFAGTGTTGAAAFREGFRAVLIEREAEYQADIRRRMKLELAGPEERARELVKASGDAQSHDDLPLWGGVHGQ